MGYEQVGEGGCDTFQTRWASGVPGPGFSALSVCVGDTSALPLPKVMGQGSAVLSQEKI